MGLLLLALVALAIVGSRVIPGLIAPTVNRSLGALEPEFRARFEGFLSSAHAAGLPLIVSETRRTPERQAWLYGSSRASYVYKGVEYGHPGPWLTNRTPETRSKHQDGLAVDVIPHPSVARAESSEAIAVMKTLEPIAKEHGLKNLASIGDYGHWENA